MQDDIVHDFIEETGELLALAERRLMALEHSPHDGQIVGDLFRIVHTIKGNSRFLSLGVLEGIAHAAEMVLDAFRQGSLTPDPATINTLLAAMDAISAHVGALAGDNDAGPDGTELIAHLNSIARTGGPREKRA